ncbi:MAG TPA: TerB family tellurite resistance protein [Thermoanaerobaculia bacterium]|nr:TerB family tellurite resistance protein [Thermoanaerobaculia bacterium]
MLRFVRELLAASPPPAAAADDREPVRIAVAALLQKMASADFSDHPSERDEMQAAVRRFLDLDAEEALALIERGRNEAADSVSLYEFTALLHRELELEQKIGVVELLWQIAFADGAVHPQEEHLVRKVASLLHVPHAEFIAAKRRARDASAGAG